jgi:hypothetical protein
MNDAIVIFSGLRDLANLKEGKSDMTINTNNSFLGLLSSAGIMAKLVEEIAALLRSTQAAPLLHPETMGYHAKGGIKSPQSDLSKLQHSIKFLGK